MNAMFVPPKKMINSGDILNWSVFCNYKDEFKKTN